MAVLGVDVDVDVDLYALYPSCPLIDRIVVSGYTAQIVVFGIDSLVIVSRSAIYRPYGLRIVE